MQCYMAFTLKVLQALSQEISISWHSWVFFVFVNHLTSTANAVYCEKLEYAVSDTEEIMERLAGNHKHNSNLLTVIINSFEY